MLFRSHLVTLSSCHLVTLSLQRQEDRRAGERDALRRDLLLARLVARQVFVKTHQTLKLIRDHTICLRDHLVDKQNVDNAIDVSLIDLLLKHC